MAGRVDPEAFLEALIREAEQRVATKPEALPRAAERVAGAIQALLVAEALEQQSAKRWWAIMQERLPFDPPPDERSFSFRGAGKRPGELIKAVTAACETRCGLTVDRILVFSEGVAVEWSYRPVQPWHEGAPPPFGDPPEGWPASAPTPAPPAFVLSDDAGTAYRVWGWSVDGSHAAWGGESRFVPTPAATAQQVVVRFGDLIATADV